MSSSPDDFDVELVEMKLRVEPERPPIRTPQPAKVSGISKPLVIIGSLIVLFLPTPFVVWFIHHTIQTQETLQKAALKQASEQEKEHEQKQSPLKLSKKKSDYTTTIPEHQKFFDEPSAYIEFAEPHKSQLVNEWKMELEEVQQSIEINREAMNRAKSGAEREMHEKLLTIHTRRLARLQKNNPPYVTRKTADHIAKYREETDDKDIVEQRLKRREKAEAEAKSKDDFNRKAHDMEVERVKAAYDKDQEKFNRDQTDFEESVTAFQAAKANREAAYDKAVKLYQVAHAEYAAAKDLNVARAFYTDKKGINVALRRFREIIGQYPDTQAAKDAQILLNDGFVNPRKTPAEPVAPALPAKAVPPKAPTKPNLILPPRPDLASVVYPPDPVSQAVIEAAHKSEAEIDAYSTALRAVDSEGARRLREEFEIDGFTLFVKSLAGKRGPFSGEITGTVVNRHDRRLRYVEIRFNLYDDSGAQVGTALANINDLEPGGRWNFRAVTLNNRWTSYKFTKLSGF